jgi:hypothetical protein
MIYHGKVKDGVIVLNENKHLSEGAEVHVQAVPEDILRLRQMLLEYAGTVKGHPADGARNHEHHLYGTPKR